MAKRLRIGLALAASALGVALGCGGAWAQGAGPFTLTSTTFKDGQMMPRKVANNNPAGTATPNPNCVGDNVSPQFSWTGAPADTKSFVMTMVDPEGRGGAGVMHWLAYGMPATKTSFAEGETTSDGPTYIGGKSTQGVGHYSGPCTPPGSAHHYTFVVIATDFDPKQFAPGMTIPEMWAQLPGHAKGAAGIVGLFQHPQ